jgi:hypothetical protein
VARDRPYNPRTVTSRKELGVSDQPVLRLFTFQPLEVGSAFDASLRDRTLPRLLRVPGIVDAYVARQGPDENGERVIASVWTSHTVMAAEFGDLSDIGRFQPRRTHDFSSSTLSILPIEVAVRPEGREPPRVLRIFRGRTRLGDLESYVEEVRAGTLADAATNEGLVALYLGVEQPSRFVTVSAWTGWPAIELATGGDVRKPVSTKNSSLITAFEVSHFEVLPNTARPRVRVQSGVA